MTRGSTYALLTVGLLVMAVRGSASIFAGPHQGLGLSNGALASSWDVSNVISSDTTHGMQFSGSFSFTVTSPGEGYTDLFNLSDSRQFAGPGMSVMLFAKLSANDISVSGPVNVFYVATTAGVQYGTDCTAIAGVASGSVFAGLTGPIGAVSDSVAGCVTPPAGPAALALALSVQYYTTGEGVATITIDLGNTASSEAQEAGAVPEPSTVVTVSSAALLIFLRRAFRSKYAAKIDK